MSDKFFTIMVVPERSDRIRKLSIPTLYLRLFAAFGIALVLGGLFFFFDYLHVLSQVAENKRLRVDNHVLRLDVSGAKSRLEALDQSLGRLKSFANKLRVLGNLDSPSGNSLIKAPESFNPGAPSGNESEDSGTIDVPDHSSSTPAPKDDLYSNREDVDEQLEQQRSLTLGGELAPNFDTLSLIDQVAQISYLASQLRENAEAEEQNYPQLTEMFGDKVDRLLSTPSIVPTRGYLSSVFGYRFNPYSGARTFHAGIDIANSLGTPVYAPADGLVTFTGVLGGFGQVLRIDHGYNLVSKYGHTAKILAKKDQRVRRGDLIAEMGNTGRSTGPHLHYQIEFKGRPVNPKFFILEDTF